MAKEAPKVHEWEESKSGIRKHYRKILYPTLGVALVASTTAAIALPLMVKKIAEERTKGILEKMIPLGGPENSLSKMDKISYMAIGDSITSGYNGYLGTDKDLDVSNGNAAASKTDYLSYADFIANDLQKSGKLYDYRNFATEGDRIPNIREKIFRDTTALKALQKSNLISITAGANDLLAAVEVLSVSFNAVRGQSQLDRIANINNAREKMTSILALNSMQRPTSVDGVTRARSSSPSSYASVEDIKHLVNESFDKLTNILSSGSMAGLLDMEQELLEHIFDLIQLDLATLIAEVHTASPDAKIVVLGYAFPFHLLPDSLINSPIAGRTIDGKPATLKDVFGEFVKTIKTICDRANYIKFFDINDLKEFSDKADVVDWDLAADTASKSAQVHRHGSEWDRVMPNPFDIHPSTYGHQVIAGHVYEWMLRDMGNKNVLPYESIQKLTDQSQIANLERIYSYINVDLQDSSKPYDANTNDYIFKNLDESAKYDSSSIISTLKTIDNPTILKFAGSLLPSLLSGQKIADNYSELLKLLTDPSLTQEVLIEKVLNKLPDLLADGMVGSLDTLKAGDQTNYAKVIASAISDKSIEMKDKMKMLVGLLPTLVTGKYQPLVSSLIGTVQSAVNTDKLVDYLFEDFNSKDWEGLNINQEISKVFDVLIKCAQPDTNDGIGNMQITPTKFLEGMKALIASMDLTKVPADATMTDILSGFTIDAHKMGTVKMAEALAGILIYASAENHTQVGNIDHSQDANFDTFKELMKSFGVVLNDMMPATPSISASLVGMLFSQQMFDGMFHLADGTLLDPNDSANIEKHLAQLFDEIVTQTKTLGFDISSVVPAGATQTDKANYIMDVLLDDGTGTPALADALKKMGWLDKTK